MSPGFRDYYAILGVARGATDDEIKKAYRQKARELHPDRNKAAGAEQQFAAVTEAYAVLGDSEKRRQYDALGSGFSDGQTIDPAAFEELLRRAGMAGARGRAGAPGAGFDFRETGDPFAEIFGAATGRGAAGAPGGAGSGAAGSGGFSDFFEALFGAFGGFAGSQSASFTETRQQSRQSSSRRRTSASVRPGAGADAAGGPGAGQTGPLDLEVDLDITLEELAQPRPRALSVSWRDEAGQTQRTTVTINIPPGVRPGQRIRVAGRGRPGAAGAPSGDLYLRLRVRPDGRFRFEGDDLVGELALDPALAVVGGTAAVATLDGGATVRIAPGTQPDARLRLRGRGLARADGTRGDLLVRVRIVIPTEPTPDERRLYEQLAALRQPPKDDPR